MFGGVSKDKRKFYTYTAKSLKELALKLKIEDPEEYQLSKANQEWEQWLKVEEDYSFELFGE